MKEMEKRYAVNKKLNAILDGIFFTTKNISQEKKDFIKALQIKKRKQRTV